MSIRNVILKLLLCIISLTPLHAISKEQKSCKFNRYIKESEVRLAVLNAGIGMPPHFLNGRLQPGVQLGLQHPFRQRHKKCFGDYTLWAGYFAQRSLQRSSFIKPGLGYSVPVYKHIMLRPAFHLALMSVRATNDEFKRNDQGIYEQVSRCRFQIMPGFGAETSMPLAHRNKFQYAFTFGYELGFQLPFSQISSVLPMNIFHAGIKINSIKK